MLYLYSKKFNEIFKKLAVKFLKNFIKFYYFLY